jgi:hypothetical protein
MTQELGETRDAIMADANKTIEDILNANSHLQETYWIVVFAKPSKYAVDGKPALMQHIKPYRTKPSPQVGQIVAEVDNKTGELRWEINMPDVPFDYSGLPSVQHISGGVDIVETTTIPHAYRTSAAG